MLWEEEEVSDPSAALRKRRYRLRDDLRRAVPDLSGDPFPADMSHGERVATMNPDLISSDVHEFLELLKIARTLDGAETIGATMRRSTFTRVTCSIPSTCRTTGGCMTALRSRSRCEATTSGYSARLVCI